MILDAPCTATGTIRRHPDILRLKAPEDVARMAGVQRPMLAHAATLVREGGTLVYSTCSLEPEEGQAQVEAFLADHRNFERVPIAAQEIGGEADWITPAGDLRTLPFHMAIEPEELGGHGWLLRRPPAPPGLIAEAPSSPTTFARLGLVLVGDAS